MIQQTTFQLTWVSVLDDIPEEQIKVLLCDKYGWIFTGFWDGCCFESCAGEEPGSDVTYWTAIPSPIQ